MTQAAAAAAAAGPVLPPVHPIDHGYAWLVCLGAFGANFFVNGGMRSTGILFVEVLEKFKTDKGTASLIMALMAAGFAVFSAIGNAVGAMTTMRRACVIGSVLTFLGMLFTSLSTGVGGVIVSLGLISGIGYGFMFGPSMVMVGQYFFKRRSLATGLASAGGSCGTLIIPIFLRHVFDTYGFNGGLLLYSAVILHAIPASLLLRPVAFYDIKRRKIGVPETVMSAAEALQTGNALESDDKSALSGNQPRPKKTPTGRATRYQLVGSRLYPAPSETSLFEPEELLAEAAKEEAEAAAAVAGAAAEHMEKGMPTLTSTQRQSDQATKADVPAAASNPPKVTLKVAVRLFGRRLFDRDLLKSWAFLMFSAGICLGQAGYVDACFFLPPFIVERWRSKRLATVAMISVGLADLASRIVSGWIADLGYFRRVYLIGFSLIVGGLAMIFVTFFRSFIVLEVGSVVLGCFGGTYQALMVVVIADLFGTEKLAPGVGLASFFMGLVILPIPPIFGSLQKAVGSFSITVQLSGALLSLGGITFYLIPKMQLHDARKKGLDGSAEPAGNDPASKDAVKSVAGKIDADKR